MQPATLNRRSFLRGRSAMPVQAQRPPWALAEADFLARCTRCDACVTACPSAILVRADGGFPAVDFSRGECTFCAECVRSCVPAALTRDGDEVPGWALKAHIGAGCLAMNAVECRVCGEACPESAIRFRPRLGGVALPELALESCNGCGACFAPCPVRAIEVKTGEMDCVDKERT